MSARLRWLLIGLAAVALAAFWPGPEDEGEVVEAVRPPPVSAPGSPSAASPRPPGAAQAKQAGAPRFDPAMRADLFPSQTWQPPPPKPAPKPARLEPPPLPAPPPLPFTYMGRWQEGGGEVVFLLQGERVLSARAGAVIDGTYRVETVSRQGVVLTYLPLNMQQTLRIEP